MQILQTLLRLARIGLLILGPIFLLIAGITGYSTNSFVKRAAHATGTITALEPRTDQDGDTNYYPHFVFNAPDGSPHTIISSTGSSPSPFKVGQQVNVLFEAADPNKAQIDNFTQLWFLPLIFGIIGFVIVLVAVGIIYFERKLKPVAIAPPPVVTSRPIEPV